MGQLTPLFKHSHENPSLRPSSVLDQYLAKVPLQPQMNPGGQQSARTPSNSNFGASPAMNQLGLPEGANPNNTQGMQNSPAAVAMASQQSQQGSSSGVSATTSPNVNNKRRRPSLKEEEGQSNGTGPGIGSGNKVKPSPRIGGKRQKGGPA